MPGPNLILILLDNLGYGDVGCYGNTVHRTPNIDRLAAEGMRFTSFYSTSGVCTPSRASFLTGCYPRRVSLHVNSSGGAVLMPMDHKGLHPDEVTVARLLQGAGYATGCIGKWHLGDQEPFWPTRHGFDSYFGIPYSEDMVPTETRPHWPPLPLMRGEQVVEAPVDRAYLTRRYTEEALGFLEANRDRPFFLYLPHAMPGSTAHPFASPAFEGRSANGPYGDAVEELDWSTGQIMDALERLGLAESTVVVWTSDNGAVFRDPQQGSNAPLKGWGYDTSEGAQRMPCIVRWPSHVPAGAVCDEVVSSLDILPTFAALAGRQPPEDRVIDGHDIQGLLRGDPGARSPYDGTGFFFYHKEQLQAVRCGPWKLYLPLAEKLVGLSGRTAEVPAFLYNVREDPGEISEVSRTYPEVVARLTTLADAAREELGDLGREGRGQRLAGWVEDPQPCLLRDHGGR